MIAIGPEPIDLAAMIAELVATGPEAAGLWERHEVAILQHEYLTRIGHPDHGIIPAQMIFMPFSPRLWQYTLVLPPGIKPPHPGPEPPQRTPLKHPLSRAGCSAG